MFDEMFGIEFTYKNNDKEWFDPLSEYDFKENNEYFIIEYFSYDVKIKKDDILTYRKYQLCNKCGSEIGTCCCNEI